MKYNKLFNICKNFYLLGIIILCLGLEACSKSSSDSNELSFAGITVGKPFPDSLKINGKYEYHDDGIPHYEGKIKFDFPSKPKTELIVWASTDLKNDEVINISIETYDNPDEIAANFYDMLKNKYGLPESKFGDTDCNLRTLEQSMLEKLDSNSDGTINDSDFQIVATWKPASCSSVIRLSAYISNYIKDGVPQIDIHYVYEYRNENKYKEVWLEVKQREKQEEKNKYLKNNSELMNQDF